MFDFGRRRIVPMNYTRYISIPKDWLRFQKIDEGDEISIRLTEDGNLLLVPVKEGEKDAAK